jgi:uncharacterized protein YdiU (UPF0061 family)
LAEALLPLFDSDENKAVEIAKESLGKFPDRFQHYWISGMRAKLGLFNEEAGDVALIESLLQGMLRSGSDYTNTLRALDPQKVCGVDAAWHEEWSARLTRQSQTLEEARSLMRCNSPVVIPRNHKVEEALEAATSIRDYQPLHRLLAALANPYEDGLEKDGYREPSQNGSAGYQTFCGT